MSRVSGLGDALNVAIAQGIFGNNAAQINANAQAEAQGRALEQRNLELAQAREAQDRALRATQSPQGPASQQTDPFAFDTSLRNRRRIQSADVQDAAARSRLGLGTPPTSGIQQGSIRPSRDPFAFDRALRQKKQQQASDLQFEAFRKWATDPNNAVSFEEIAQGAEKLASDSAARATVNPDVLYRAEDDDSNPATRKSRMAESLVKLFPNTGLGAEDMVSLITFDDKGGSNIAEIKKLLQEKTPTPPNAIDISRALSIQEDRIKQLNSDPVLFNADGLPNQPTEDNRVEFDAKMRQLQLEKAQRDVLFNSLIEKTDPELARRMQVVAETRRLAAESEQQQPTDTQPATRLPAAPEPEKPIRTPVAPPLPQDVLKPPKPLSQLSQPVVFANTLSPTGERMPVITSAESYRTLLARGDVFPNSFFTDENGTLFRIDENGTPKRVK